MSSLFKREDILQSEHSKTQKYKSLMQNTRRIFLKYILASAIATTSISASHAFAETSQTIKPTPAEQKTISYMGNHGITEFIMLNKERGQILFIEDSKIVRANSALSGQLKGDEVRDDFMVTPAGIHIMRSHGNGDSIGFLLTDTKDAAKIKTDYSIHTVINPTGQNRLIRLAGNNPNEKRISSGCVNVSQDTLDQLLKFIDRPHQIFYSDKNEPYVMGSFFCCLARDKTLRIYTSCAKNRLKIAP